MRTSDRGIAALISHEGIVPAPYLDSVGVWTFGVGHTAAAGSPNPSKMPRGMPDDLEAALHHVFMVFARDLVKYEDDVNRAVKVPLKQHEFDALVSFHYNTGAIARASLTGHLNRGDRTAAAVAFMSWKKPAAIIDRRRAEQHLFLTGVYPSISLTVWGVTQAGKVIWKPIASLPPAIAVSKIRSAGDAPRASTTANPAPAITMPVLRRGENPSKAAVERLQKLLGVKVDGSFGPATEAAVIAFQRKNNLVPDGIVGKATWAALGI